MFPKFWQKRVLDAIRQSELTDSWASINARLGGLLSGIPQPPIQLHGCTHIGQGVVSFVGVKSNSEVVAKCSEFEIGRWPKIGVLLKEPESSLERTVDAIVGREVQLLPFEPLAKKRAVESSVVGDQTSLPEATSISRVSTGDRVPNQELAKP